MAARGIQEFYYTRDLPDRAVAIARVETTALTPEQLTDIDNHPYAEGERGVWLETTEMSSTPDFPQVNGAYVQAELGSSFIIHGAVNYRVTNQFFQMTGKASAAGAPLYYRHQLPRGNFSAVVIDLSGQRVDGEFLIEDDGVTTWLYHDLDGAAYRVRYTGRLGTETHLLHYQPVMSQGQYAADENSYLNFGRELEVSTTGSLWMRFTANNGYRLLSPYNGLPNAPWYVRVRFATAPWPPEWAHQLWLPRRPYMFGIWVPGRVVDKHILEFERKPLLLDPNQLPDILVFDKDNAIKYALEGTSQGPDRPRRRGDQYPWRRGMIDPNNVDAERARVELKIDLETSDIVFGFYSYREPDILYRDLDVNPFTNPAVRDKVVYFYYDLAASDPQRSITHVVVDAHQMPPYVGESLSNHDLQLSGWATIEVNGVRRPSWRLFGSLMVGASVGPGSFTWQDERSYGGGLKPGLESQVPESVNFMDVGYIDGKPYPVGGGLVMHLPSTILKTMSAQQVQAKVEEIMPLGTMPVIFFYDQTGQDYR